MRIDDPEDRPISDGAAAIIGALLQSAPGGHPTAIIDDVIVRVACGIATQDEEIDVIGEAAQSASKRHRFTEIKRRALALAKFPLGSAPVESDIDRQIIEGLRTKMLTSLQAAESPQGGIASPNWQDFLKRAGAEANAVRQLVRAMGASLMQSHMRVSFATHRDQADDDVTTPLAKGVSGRIGIRSLEGGTLNVAVTVHADLPADLEAVKGRALILSLADPAGGSAPLHSAPLQDSIWEVALDRFDLATGLDPASVTASDFRIHLESEVRFAAPRRYLYVEVPPELQREGVSLFPVELAAPPLIRKNTMVLELRLPEDIPRLYNDALLEISVGLGSSAQRIGSTDLAGWPEGSRKVEIPVPSIPDAQIECGSIIQLRLAPSV